VLKVINKHFPSLDPLTAPSSEEKYLEGLVASLTSVDEKVDEVLTPIRKKLAKTLAIQELTETALVKCTERTSQWHHRAVNAVEQGNDELAKQALARKLHYQNEVEIYSKQLATTKLEIDAIRDILIQTEATTQNVSRKMQLFISRAKIAAGTSKAHRKTAAALRNAALSKLDTQIYELQDVSDKDLIPLSLLAVGNLSKLFASVEIEVLSLEAHVIHWNTSPRPHQNPKETDDAIQRELNLMKKSQENDQPIP
jgi:phage shock protein A